MPQLIRWMPKAVPMAVPGWNWLISRRRRGLLKGGINRILLATDGDFNVGIDDPKSIESMVKTTAESGVTLSTFGVGIAITTRQ